MKKTGIVVLALMMSIGLMACGGKETKQSEGAKTESSAAQESAKTGAEDAKDAKDAKEIKGSILEVKDFMFSIKADDGKEYALNFDKAPEGLSEVKAGDEVVVKYTGELSEVDSFTGTILSVKKA